MKNILKKAGNQIVLFTILKNTETFGNSVTYNYINNITFSYFGINPMIISSDVNTIKFHIDHINYLKRPFTKNHRSIIDKAITEMIPV